MGREHGTPDKRLQDQDAILQISCKPQVRPAALLRAVTDAIGPVEPRTTSSGANRSSSVGTGAPPMSESSVVTALRPMDSIGCRTVVSGGSAHAISAESAKPTTGTSAGT